MLHNVGCLQIYVGHHVLNITEPHPRAIPSLPYLPWDILQIKCTTTTFYASWSFPLPLSIPWDYSGFTRSLPKCLCKLPNFIPLYFPYIFSSFPFTFTVKLNITTSKDTVYWPLYVNTVTAELRCNGCKKNSVPFFRSAVVFNGRYWTIPLILA